MADGLNKVMLIGNLGRDPEQRYTASGSAVTTFSLAVSRSFGGAEGRSEETEWCNVVTWNKLAELCGQHLKKGRKVYVEGRLATRSWEGPDGTKKYRTEVIANQVLYLDKSTEAEPDADGLDDDALPFE